MKTLAFSMIVGFLMISIVASAQNGYRIGQKVDDFALQNIDGQTVAMADYPDAKGFIITFTCNTCPWAQKYEDRINQLSEKYADKGFPLIAINPNDPAAKPGDSFTAMQTRADQKDFSFPYLVDHTSDVARAFGATKTPDMFVVEKTDEGLYLRYRGAVDDNPANPAGVSEKFVEEAVDALLQGKEIEKVETKAIGCSIKFRTS